MSEPRSGERARESEAAVIALYVGSQPFGIPEQLPTRSPR